MHPAVGMLLERVVPSSGTFLAGHRFPAGTVVGINPWVAARDKAVYGDDADIFRPERWIESTQEHLKIMERSFLAVSCFSTILKKLFHLPVLIHGFCPVWRGDQDLLRQKHSTPRDEQIGAATSAHLRL